MQKIEGGGDDSKLLKDEEGIVNRVWFVMWKLQNLQLTNHKL